MSVLRHCLSTIFVGDAYRKAKDHMEVLQERTALFKVSVDA